MEDLQLVEHVVREDEGVVEQCVISGIPREEMHKVYCDRKCFDLLLSLSLSFSHQRRNKYYYQCLCNHRSHYCPFDKVNSRN